MNIHIILRAFPHNPQPAGSPVPLQRVQREEEEAVWVVAVTPGGQDRACKYMAWVTNYFTNLYVLYETPIPSAPFEKIPKIVYCFRAAAGQGPWEGQIQMQPHSSPAGEP